jgi:hypothetical protein
MDNNSDELEYTSNSGSELEYVSDSGPAPQHHRLVNFKLYKIFINLIYFYILFRTHYPLPLPQPDNNPTQNNLDIPERFINLLYI